MQTAEQKKIPSSFIIVVICDTSQLDHDKPAKVLQMKCVRVLAEHIPSRLHEDGMEPVIPYWEQRL